MASVLLDFWGIEKVMPELDDDMGTSAVMINTKEGGDAFSSIECIKASVPHSDAIRCNSSWHASTDAHSNRLRAFKLFRTKRFFRRKAMRIISPKIKLWERVANLLKKYF